MRHVVLVLLLVSMLACGGPPSAVPVEVGRDVCAQCRQPVTDVFVSAQIVADGEAPVFFDDIGCLADYLARNTRLGRNAIAYVADHQNGEWIVAASALYTRNLRVVTPKQSHLIAHGSVETQATDPAVRTGIRVTLKELLPVDMPDGTR